MCFKLATPNNELELGTFGWITHDERRNEMPTDSDNEDGKDAEEAGRCRPRRQQSANLP
jgi:hypothetical protein